MLRLAVLVVRRTAVPVVLLLLVLPWLTSRTGPSGRPASPLVVTGDVQGLAPGTPGRLVLTVHNGGPRPAVVHRLTAVPEEDRPGCALAVEPWSGTLAVAGGGASSQALVVRVSGARCADLSWRLAYSAS